MKKLAMIMMVAAGVLCFSPGVWAGTADWKVATVHGYDRFSISPD
ncbi:hypothetical protein LCGC14_3149040, partial [marine sediment metagenome]